MADTEIGEHVVGGNDGQAPQFASLCQSCAAVPPLYRSADKMFGIPIQTPSGNNTSILEMLGVFPLFLLTCAIAVGVAALVIRNCRFNIAAGCALISIGFFGLGTTAWRIFIYNRSIIYGGGFDPTQALSDFSIAWMPSGVVLPACGFGFMLLSLSYLFTKGEDAKHSNAEQVVGGNGGQAP